MNPQYIIIGGTTKAATTSLFEYLCAHPDVCGSKYKESRFFLDESYPLEKKIKYGDLKHYSTLFDGCLNKPVRLEATPDYLYSEDTPNKIKQLIPDVKLIFIIREPISRLISWYKFALQNNLLSSSISFEEFVALQQKTIQKYNAQQHLMALEQGKYAQYLRPYYETFGEKKILILFYEDISNNRLAVMKEVCKFIGIDEKFYSEFDFQIHNQTKHLRSTVLHNVYRSTRKSFRKLIPKSTFIGKWLRNKQKKQIEPLYLKMNQANHTDQLKISAHVLSFLKSYYTGQKETLESLCGKKTAW